MQSSDLRNLIDMHHEVSLYFDDEQDGPAIASTETDGPMIETDDQGLEYITLF
jgi:hypothetical protein